MIPKVRYRHWVFRLPGMGRWRGMTLWPYILLRDAPGGSTNDVLRHEMVHWNQIEHFGMIGFYLRWVWWTIRYGYEKNPFEREARGNRG